MRVLIPIKSLNKGKKIIKYIVLPVFTILLMSHNVWAVDMSPNVHPIWTNASPDCTYYTPDGSTFYNDLYNGTTNFLSISYISCAVPAGLQSNKTYAVYSFILDNIPDNNSLDAGFRAVKARHGSGGDGGWGVVGVGIDSIANNGAKVDFYLYGEKSNTTAGTVVFYNPYNANELFYIEPTERITVSGASYWQVDTTDFEYDYRDVLNSINSHLSTIEARANSINSYMYYTRVGVDSINNKLDDLSQDTADAVNNGQADATQDASDNSSTAGSSSSSDATSATSSLLSVIGAGIGAITTASPTNCRINGDMGNLDIGNIDLCANPVPAFVAVIGSIIAVLVVLPLVIVLFNRFISIIRSFQG